jgi:hypothetical protein
LDPSGGSALGGWRFDKHWEGMTHVEWLFYQQHTNSALPDIGQIRVGRRLAGLKAK